MASVNVVNFGSIANEPIESDTAESVPIAPLLETTIPARSQRLPLETLQRNVGTFLIGACAILAFITFWYFATKYRWNFYIRFTNIPSPVEVYDNALRLLVKSSYANNILVSLRRILIGFGIAGLFGVTLGLIIGRYHLVRNLIFPVLEVLRPIPAIAWVPMAIMLWPTNEVSIVFITFLGSFFPILLSTIHGVETVDKVLLRAARSLGANEVALFREVILPGAMPHIFTGFAVGMGVAWVSLIAAEMISGQFGVGYFTWEAYSLIQYADIVVGMITIGILGLTCSAFIRGLGKITMPWTSFNSRETQT